MSGSTAAAIPTACAAPRSRSGRGSSPSPTPSTHSLPAAPTARPIRPRRRSGPSSRSPAGLSTRESLRPSPLSRRLGEVRYSPDSFEAPARSSTSRSRRRRWHLPPHLAGGDDPRLRRHFPHRPYAPYAEAGEGRGLLRHRAADGGDRKGRRIHEGRRDRSDPLAADLARRPADPARSLQLGGLRPGGRRSGTARPL